MPRAAAGLALAGLLVASRIFTLTRPDGPVALGGRHVPTICPIRLATGRRCPGCGMFRGLLYTMRGDLRRALRANPAAPLFAAWLVRRAAIEARPGASEARP